MLSSKLFIIFLNIYLCLSLPVQEKKINEHPNDINHPSNDKDHPENNWENQVEYSRYLKEVVKALEDDPDFRKKLENVNESDIKEGNIAQYLPIVKHSVREKLNELKRNELERVRHAMNLELEKKQGINRQAAKIPGHLDNAHPAFQPEDLKKLILQYGHDVENIRKRQEDEFKRFEMDKQYKYKHDLEKLNEQERQKAVREHDEALKRKKQHPKYHHPGSKAQYEEVWEEQDHMKPEDFDPVTFFHTHDLDGNNAWDEYEVKALFKNELDKAYNPNASEDELREKYEEMERMREHVFTEVDTDRDGFISFEEFIAETKKNEFQEDPGWQGLEDQNLFTDEDYQEFLRAREAEDAQGHYAAGAEEPNGINQIHNQQVKPHGGSELHHAPEIKPVLSNKIN